MPPTLCLMLIDGEHERTVSNSVPGFGKFLCLFQTSNDLVGTVSRTSGCPSMSSITRSTRFPKPSVAVVPKILSFGSWKKGEVRDVLDVTEGEDKPAY